MTDPRENQLEQTTSASTKETEAHPAVVVPSPASTAEHVARRFPRVKCFLAVQLQSHQDGRLLVGSLSDISLGGCCVETSSPLPSETPLAISPLDAANMLWVEGIVVNTRVADSGGNFKLGIRFPEADPKPSHTLKEFLRFVEEINSRQEAADSAYLRHLSGH